MKIQVIGLENCSRCKALKDALNYSKVDYSFSTCEKYSNICDSLENLTECKNYPMVLLSGLEKDILETIYITDSISILEEGINMKNGIRLVPNHSVDGLIRYIMNRLDLKL